MHEEVELLLKSKGIKITPQRKAILKVIAEQKGQHLTTEDIYKIIKAEKETEKIGLATIYRSLDLYVQTGLISKISIAGAPAKYEISLPAQSFHHHLICLHCGKIQEIDSDVMTGFERKIEKLKGFQLARKSIKIYGYCSECKKIDTGKRKRNT